MRVRDRERLEAGGVEAPEHTDAVAYRHRTNADAEPAIAPLVRVMLDAPETGAHARSLDPFPHAEGAHERGIEVRMISPAEFMNRFVTKAVRQQTNQAVRIPMRVVEDFGRVPRQLARVLKSERGLVRMLRPRMKDRDAHQAV